MPKFDVKNWKNNYKKKQLKLDDLAEIIKPGSRIFIGTACSEPEILTKQLVQKNVSLFDCQLVHYFSFSKNQFFDEFKVSKYRHNTLSMIASPQMREAVNSGKSDYTPIRSAEIPELLARRQYRIDVALIQVGPPDINGFCSLGINVDINLAIVKAAKIVIAQINPQMPRTMGNSFVKFSDIDYFIFEDAPLMEYKQPKPDENTEKIAEYISRLIEDGSTLNLGIGKIPYLLPKYLKEKKKLAIYSEFILESIWDLIEEEVISCQKNVYPHCMVSFALGTNKFYKNLSDNPFIEFYPTDFITNINNIMNNHKMCSIYSALTVDLIGQVTNDLKSGLYSGIGGEADFMRGTALSKNGKCIIALPSTTDDGRSRILPILSTQPIAVPSFDVHYVVTEWGIANLHGKSIRERIMQMIGVAHPMRRKWLLEAAKKYHFAYQDQRLPLTQDGVVVVYPDLEWNYQSKSKGTIKFRPVKPTDERIFQDLFYSLSEHDRMMRFFQPKKVFSHKETQRRILCDYHSSFVFVGLVGEEEVDQQIVAVGAYYLDRKTNLVEISMTVHKDYRRQGLARYIIQKIINLAQEKSFAGISGDVLMSNDGMIHILQTLPYNVVFIPEGISLAFAVNFSDVKENNKGKEKKEKKS
ncbi:MAG: GNAT family N-acetyltransferase [archaeon]|nr:GNAT family N-acetyltransferase [archaeon]